MSKDACEQLLSQYTFTRANDPPAYYVLRAKHRETSQAVTIKVSHRPTEELFRYLSKLKETKSEYVIRITDLARSSDRMVAVCQDITCGTLYSALAKCNRLEDNDALLVAKTLLQGRIDLLRNQCDWRGNERDIDLTDSGIKLSWGNGGESPAGTVNPFPALLQRISFKPEREQAGILPFPKSKQIMDLIKVCVENASEMSLHPLLKKRDKILKKKGKGWVGIRQIKLKAEYYDETVFFAVSPTHGFVRVKVYETGVLSKEVMVLYRGSHPNFVRILEHYEQANTMTMISEYSNDGNVQSYVTRLKSANVTLKEDQIEFFLYSLIEPLKQVQKSTILSLNYLHIKNIFIENGIPKIGEPVPLSVKMEENLRDRADVPDFYHPRYKANPAGRQPDFDTYSLGILLYKLMYTQYPIFPEGKVHVPTSPNYNQRIKQTLLVFLNEGGRLVDIETKFEVSEAVKQQIQVNKVILNEKITSSPRQKQTMVELEDVPAEIKQGDGKSCWQKLCQSTKTEQQPAEAYNTFYQNLQESAFKKYRICTKIVLVVSLYTFLFYLTMFSNVVTLFSRSGLLQTYNATISGTTYTVITSDSFNFDSTFNATPTLSNLQNNMKCLIDGNGTYSSFVHSRSGIWYAYLASALIIAVVVLLLKCWQLAVFDLVKAVHNYQTKVSNYNITRWLLFHLISCLVIYSHFFFYQWIFYQQTSPCLGGDTSQWFSSTAYFFNNRNQLMTAVAPIMLAIFLLGIFSFLEVLLYMKISYSKIINSIVFLLPFYLALTIMARLGVYTPITPSAINDTNSTIRGYFSGNVNYVGILGIIPEFLLIGELLLSYIVDLIFFRCLNRKMKNMFKTEQHLPEASFDDIRT